MRLEVLRDDDQLIHLALHGRLDVQGVSEIQYEFLQQTTWLPKRTIVDLGDVSYVASLGISMFVSAAKELELKGARLVLLDPKPLVRKALETSGMHGLVPIAAGEAAAIELLR